MASGLTTIDTAPVPRLALRRAEAAEALGVSDRTLQDWVRKESVPHIRINGCLLFPVSELQQWLAERSTAMENAGA